MGECVFGEEEEGVDVCVEGVDPLVPVMMFISVYCLPRIWGDGERE